MINRQLELGFENRTGLRPGSRRQGRSRRAHLWFERMRGVVDEAHDWPSAYPPRCTPLPGEATAPPGLSPSGAALQGASAGPVAAGGNSPGQEPRRWNFGRARRPVWE